MENHVNPNDVGGGHNTQFLPRKDESGEFKFLDFSLFILNLSNLVFHSVSWWSRRCGQNVPPPELKLNS